MNFKITIFFLTLNVPNKKIKKHKEKLIAAFSLVRLDVKIVKVAYANNKKKKKINVGEIRGSI